MHLFLIDPGREQDQKADRFFNHVLPRHAASLQTLSCGAGYEGQWSFGVHNADAIAGLPNLASLEMSVNLADITNLTTSMNRNAVVRPCLGSEFEIVLAHLSPFVVRRNSSSRSRPSFRRSAHSPWFPPPRRTWSTTLTSH
jgi:hypothetical protein